MSATVIGTPEYSNYIGSPITVPVTAANYAGATFHRVRLKVTVNGDSDNPFEFTDAVQKKVVQGVEVVQTNEFDISSALRAFSDNYAYTPDIPAVYPSFTAVCVACSDYMIDGEEYQTEKVDYNSKITPPTPPEKAGFDFAWGEYPETMPAHDITISGTYTTGIMSIEIESDKAKIFTLDGKQIYQAQKGVNIVRMNNGSIKKVVVK